MRRRRSVLNCCLDVWKDGGAQDSYCLVHQGRKAHTGSCSQLILSMLHHWDDCFFFQRFTISNRSIKKRKQNLWSDYYKTWLFIEWYSQGLLLKWFSWTVVRVSDGGSLDAKQPSKFITYFTDVWIIVVFFSKTDLFKDVMSSKINFDWKISRMRFHSSKDSQNSIPALSYLFVFLSWIWSNCVLQTDSFMQFSPFLCYY